MFSPTHAITASPLTRLVFMYCLYLMDRFTDNVFALFSPTLLQEISDVLFWLIFLDGILGNSFGGPFSADSFDAHFLWTNFREQLWWTFFGG